MEKAGNKKHTTRHWWPVMNQIDSVVFVINWRKLGCQNLFCELMLGN